MPRQHSHNNRVTNHISKMEAIYYVKGFQLQLALENYWHIALIRILSVQLRKP